MTRLHARRTPAIERDGALLAPQPGWFRPGNALGSLEVLGSTIELTIPPGTTGIVIDRGAPRAVAYGDVLGRLVAELSTGDGAAAAKPAAETQHGPVFRSPTSGRYYGRPTPDKPPFVTVGMELSTGTTICLLEVMKTFHRVTFDGESARVRDVLVVDGADVNAGDPLLALEPI